MEKTNIVGCCTGWPYSVLKYRPRLISIVFILALMLISNWIYMRYSPNTKGVNDTLDRPVGPTTIIPTKEKMHAMSDRERGDLYHKFMDTVTFHCKNIVRAGVSGDGGWSVCIDPEYRPKQPCLVYSFGIGPDFSFDLDIVKRFQCAVHSFDPTLGGTHLQKVRSNLPNFHPIGLSKQNGIRGGISYDTLEGIRKLLGHTKTELDILKMDIEMWEWESLGQSIQNHTLDDVRQLLIEFHVVGIQKNPDLYRSSLDLLRDLQDLGYRAFFVQRNPACSYVDNNIKRVFCHNIHFVKVTKKLG